ncbi:MAG: vWA domain-containing protein [Isosphaeraceae bacterium]
MEQPFPTRDPIEGLRFTFKTDKAAAAANPRTEKESAEFGEPDGRAQLHFGETPLTDPRSLGSSALMHVLLIAVASLTVLNVSITRVPEASGALRGELEPVDNRAEKSKVAGSGGGSPGEIGGLGSIAFLAPAAGANPQGPGLDPAADALLNEILPSTAQQPAEALQRALPGPQTTGVGLISGSGVGGGGSGGGSGGGIGRGIGPGTEFFGAREHGHSFAYVIDCSGSMGLRNSLEVAKHELLASLNQLPPDARFSVIFYNLRARVFADPSGQQGLMPATTANKVRVQGQLQTVAPDGGTDHMVALRTALGLKPEVIFFLTDADLMTNNDVNAILAEAQGSRIQAVEFGRGTDLGMQTPLRRLATTTGGTYRYIDVTGFPRSASGY